MITENILSLDNQQFLLHIIYLALSGCQLCLIGYCYVAFIEPSIHLHLHPCFPELASCNSVMIPLLVLMLESLGKLMNTNMWI